MKILHFADLHIGVENYGRFNPTTGLNTRLEDFLNSLDILIERAIQEKVDLVLFAGDAFKVNEPTNTHQRVFAERIQSLSQAQIPTFILIGNHDQSNKYGESHALDIYATLNIPYVYVSSRPEIKRIPTASGPLQIASLPHVSKSALLTNDDFATQTFAEVDRSIVEQVDQILDHLENQLDPEVPAILAAHVGVEQAKMGSEQSMSIGYGFTVPLNILARDSFQYVALGHIHKHQVLCENPPVVYPGSVDRVDFGEEKEDKGFMLVQLDQAGVSYEFVTIPNRRFLTLQQDLHGVLDPNAALLKAIAQAPIQDAIVRLIYKLPAQRAEEIDQKRLKQALSTAFYASIRPLLEEEGARIRMPELAQETPLTPLETLVKYLEKRPDLKELQGQLLEKAEHLWQEIHQN